MAVTPTTRLIYPRDGGTFRTKDVTLENLGASPVVIGAPVCLVDADSFKAARADVALSSRVVGLASATIAVNESGQVVVDGPLEATTAQWDAITGLSGGLTFGTVYYLSLDTGKLTADVPTQPGAFLVEIGVARSTTVLQVGIKSPILIEVDDLEERFEVLQNNYRRLLLLLAEEGFSLPDDLIEEAAAAEEEEG